MMDRLVLVSVIGMTLASCSEPGVVPASERIEVSPQLVRFGPVVIGQRAAGAIELRNFGKREREVIVRAPAPFAVDGKFILPGGGAEKVELHFSPERAGEAEAIALIESDGDELAVRLSGEGRNAACRDVPPCQRVELDPVSGSCRTVAMDDGTPCAAACVVDGTCQSGVCVGQSNTCDDQNACTLDACDAATGECVHIARACEAEGACVKAACDPQRGCITAAADDGTSCGRAGCDVQDVCIAGACVSRTPPEGATCGHPSPCRARGNCQSGACVRPPEVSLTPTWRHPTPQSDPFYFDGVTDGARRLYLSTTDYSPMPARFLLIGLSNEGALQFELLTYQATENDREAILEEPLAFAGGQLLTKRRLSAWSSEVRLRDRATGALKWAFDPHPLLKPHLPQVEGREVYAVPEVAFEAPSGALRIQVGVREHRPNDPTFTTLDTWVVDVAASSGAVLRTHPVGDPAYFHAIGAKGELYGSLSRTGQAFRFEGSTVWTAGDPPHGPGEYLIPMAHVPGHLVAARKPSGCVHGWEVVVLDAETGEERGAPALCVNDDLRDRVVARGDDAWVLGYQMGEEDGVTVGFAIGRVLARIDLRDARVRWMHRFVPVGAPALRMTSLTLTNAGSLWAVETDDSSAGRFYRLHEVSAYDGEPQAVCPMDATPLWWVRTELTLVEDAFVLHEPYPMRVLEAFPAPGFKTAPKGWSTRAGSPLRHGRAR